MDPCSMRFLDCVRNTLLRWILWWGGWLSCCYLDFTPCEKNPGGWGTIVSFPWSFHAISWSGLEIEWRGCSEEPVFWESRILCSIWWGPGVPNGGTSEKQHRIAGQSDITCFLSDFLVLLVLAGSIWRHLSAPSLAWASAWLGVCAFLDGPSKPLKQVQGGTGWARLLIRELVLVDSQCSSFPWFLFLLISLSISPHYP